MACRHWPYIYFQTQVRGDKVVVSIVVDVSCDDTVPPHPEGAQDVDGTADIELGFH
jgi:hypothetical protein